jgi:hypothetical protein
MIWAGRLVLLLSAVALGSPKPLDAAAQRTPGAGATTAPI